MTDFLFLRDALNATAYYLIRIGLEILGDFVGKRTLARIVDGGGLFVALILHLLLLSLELTLASISPLR